MDSFQKSIEIRWADLDPNFHVMHSKYYEFGAFCRMALLMELNINPAWLQQHKLGPILFREECLFKRELKLADVVTIDVALTGVSADFSKWSMQHHIYKTENKLAAIINVDGAWMDTSLRKIVKPPEQIIAGFKLAPHAENFKIY